MNATARRLALSGLIVATVLAGCGEQKPEELLASAKAYLVANDPKVAVIQLKSALQKQPNLAEARYLLGCTAEETATLSGLSKATVDRKLKLARAWLFKRLHEANPEPSANV